MKTLGKVVGGMMVVRGLVLLGWPREYLRLWGSQDSPEWIRNMVKPWEGMPDNTLRLIGMDLALIGGLMLGLASTHHSHPHAHLHDEDECVCGC